MADEKVDAAVLAELDRLAQAGVDGEPRVPVIIEHAEPEEAGGGERAVAFARLEARIRELQAGILDRLRSLGVRDVQPMTLANAIAATVTRDQVMDVARRADVRRIQLARPEQVTTSGWGPQ